MPSVADQEMSYLSDILAINGDTISDCRKAYLDLICTRSDGLIQLATGSIDDLAELNGIQYPFKADHTPRNLLTLDKLITNVANFPIAAGPGGTSALVVDGTAPVPTTNCLEVTATQAASIPRAEHQEFIPVKPGHFYTISGYGRQTVGAVKRQARLDLRWFDSSQNQISVAAGNKNVTTLGTWQRFVGNDNVAPSNAAFLRMRVGGVNMEIGEKFIWCGLMVEEGNWDETTFGKTVGAYV
jgi:hypothetical protein